MATTTTFQLIRAQTYTQLATITPSTNAGDLFLPCPQKDLTVKDWALKTPTNACFRKLEFRSMGWRQIEPFASTEYEREEKARLTIAYPLTVRLYDHSTVAANAVVYEGLDALEDTIDADAQDLINNIAKSQYYAAGVNAQIYEAIEVDRSNDGVYFVDIDFICYYLHSQSL